MAKAAIISDIHGNLEALLAVLDHIDRQSIDEIICLGDIVGYGPDPIACTDLVRSRCKVVIRGNHDQALVTCPLGFSRLAREAIEWTQRVMRPRFYRLGSRQRWSYLSDLPPSHQWKGYLLVHGSPREPTSEYVMPQEVKWPPPGKFEEIFGGFDTVCFVGHTHIPGVFEEGPRFTFQREIEGSFHCDDGNKMLINVGSVGQPRDGDWRACYLTVDEEEFRFHRVEYPVETTRAKIRDIGELDDKLSERLGIGE